MEIQSGSVKPCFSVRFHWQKESKNYPKKHYWNWCNKSHWERKTWKSQNHWSQRRTCNAIHSAIQSVGVALCTSQCQVWVSTCWVTYLWDVQNVSRMESWEKLSVGKLPLLFESISWKVWLKTIWMIRTLWGKLKSQQRYKLISTKKRWLLPLICKRLCWLPMVKLALFTIHEDWQTITSRSHKSKICQHHAIFGQSLNVTKDHVKLLQL